MTPNNPFGMILFAAMAAANMRRRGMDPSNKEHVAAYMDEVRARAAKAEEDEKARAAVEGADAEPTMTLGDILKRARAEAEERLRERALKRETMTSEDENLNPARFGYKSPRAAIVDTETGEHGPFAMPIGRLIFPDLNPGAVWPSGDPFHEFFSVNTDLGKPYFPDAKPGPDFSNDPEVNKARAELGLSFALSAALAALTTLSALIVDDEDLTDDIDSIVCDIEAYRDEHMPEDDAD